MPSLFAIYPLFVRRIVFLLILFSLLSGFTPLTATPGRPQTDTAGQPLPTIVTGPTGLNPIAEWYAGESDDTHALAWGDVDNDGDLDLAVGNVKDQPTKLYINENGVLQSVAAWRAASVGDATVSLAWGDINNDGYLDLAVGNNSNYPAAPPQYNKVYLNQPGPDQTRTLSSTPVWVASESANTTSIAWGDVDGDGDLDLAVGNYNQPLRVYLNQGGTLSALADWSAPLRERTQSIAWGDVDNDGDLDLVVGGDAGLTLYRNDTTAPHQPQLAVVQQLTESKNIQSVAWGDANNDGALDLAVGSRNQPLRIYFNRNGVLETTASWRSTDSQPQLAMITWGDVDGDGDLDLAVSSDRRPGQFGQTIRIHCNEQGQLTTQPCWASDADENTRAIAWGDVDGDGDLDLAASRFGAELIHFNYRAPLPETATWQAAASDVTLSVAWGDVDGDGDLDLAVGNGRLPSGRDQPQPNKLYLNNNGVLATTPAWVSPDSDITRSIAWGDVDGDGDLDLLAGNDGSPNKLYINEQGRLTRVANWPVAADSTYSVAWGDMDGDGDLDLAVGNFKGRVKVFRNEGGQLSATPVWIAPMTTSTYAVAWGDVDGDGDLDLAVGNSGQSQLYLNDRGTLGATSVWTPTAVMDTRSLAWGDMDGDGDLDLAVGNDGRPVMVFLNVAGMLQPTPAWLSTDNDNTQQVAWGDADGDGDLDLATANGAQPSKVYLNNGGMLQPYAAWNARDDDFTYGVAWGDMDGDGALDLALASSTVSGTLPATVVEGFNRVYRGLQAKPATVIPTANSPTAIVIHPTLASANFYATATLRETPTINLTFSLFDPDSQPVADIRVYYALDGSFASDRTQWREAKGQLQQTPPLATSPYPARTAANTYTYVWDVLGSDFFGQSNNVVVRIEAIPSYQPRRNRTPGALQFARVAAQTFPFRVRGGQVRVVETNHPDRPVPGAIVYRLPAGRLNGATPFEEHNRLPLQTDNHGYLQGRGELKVGDQLVALHPISVTTRSVIYRTSAAPTAQGLALTPVTGPGVQTLQISDQNTLMLFNLIVSLEWDARNEPSFVAQLERDLHRTSQLLYDLTNGQAALGQVRIYHDKGFWGEADVVIVANNNQRPSAIMGGFTEVPRDDVDRAGVPIPNAYLPGQVRMGPTWNRFGETAGIVGEDWPRTLAHELGHYLFYLADDYIGVNDDKTVMQIIDCPGTAMTDPYLDEYSEFLTAIEWRARPTCERSVAWQYLGRANWDTIKRFYPLMQISATANPGPSQLPLAVTQIQTFAPVTPTITLPDPFFQLVDGSGANIALPPGAGQAYLVKRRGTADPTDDYVIAQGSPIGTHLQAHGAAAGDRLCVFAPAVAQLGCSVVGSTAGAIQLLPTGPWAPQIQVRALTPATVMVTVTHVSDGALNIQLLPALGAASPEMPMQAQGTSFVQTVTVPDGAYYGFIRIWVPGQPAKELISDYVALEAWGGRTYAWGGRAYAWGGRAYAWGGRTYAWGAPVMSSDGQVSIFALDNPFASLSTNYTLQPMSQPPNLPTWLTPVGQGYRISSDGPLPTSALLFRYLARDVPQDRERALVIYHSADEGATWQRLPTEIDAEHNQAAVSVVGPGLYVLVATVEFQTFAPGLNNFGYPLPTSRPIAEALASIKDEYTVVYHYTPTRTADPWLIYAPSLQSPFAELVNTLTQLDPNGGYWIHVKRAVTLYLGLGEVNVASTASSAGTSSPQTNAPLPPAIYYGSVTAQGSFAPTAGMSVTALIDGVRCGETQLQLLAGGLGYVLQVRAKQSNEATCGEAGKQVVFAVGAHRMKHHQLWDNTGATLHPLNGIDDAPLPTPEPTPGPTPGPTPIPQTQVFFPVVAKR
jgi:hypothetical protein